MDAIPMEPTPARPKSSRWLGRTIGLLVAATVVLGGFLIYRQLDSVVRDSYAQWWVADLVIEHLERNDGNWPRSWDELAESFEICAGRSGKMWSLDELRARVAVDFDADLVPLKSPSDLRELHLGHSNITDSGMKALVGLNLQRIDLHGTRVTDAGPQNLLGMDRLTILVLADDNFSDFGLQYVGKLARLKLLNLNGARVSDAGLRELYGLTELRQLMLYNTQVTPASIATLRERLPDCRIEN